MLFFLLLVYFDMIHTFIIFVTNKNILKIFKHLYYFIVMKCILMHTKDTLNMSSREKNNPKLLEHLQSKYELLEKQYQKHDIDIAKLKNDIILQKKNYVDLEKELILMNTDCPESGSSSSISTKKSQSRYDSNDEAFSIEFGGEKISKNILRQS